MASSPTSATSVMPGMGDRPARQRIAWLDALRIFACLLVCTIHTPIPDTGSDLMTCRACTFLSSPCNALFFMVSGAFLFPVAAPLPTYLKKKFKRIALPLIFWSFVAIGIRVCCSGMQWDDAARALLRLPFAPVEGVYWFLYVLVTLYLFAPLVSPVIERLSHLKYLLTLWGITLILPYINTILPGTWDAQRAYYSGLGQFGGFLGYMALGYYLRYHLRESKHCTAWLTAGLLLATALAVGSMYTNDHCPGLKLPVFDNLLLNVAILACVFFVGCRHASTRYSMKLSQSRGGVYILGLSKKLLADISQQCFGIYLIHFFVLRLLLWDIWLDNLPHTPYFIQIPVLTLSTFILSYLIIKLIRLIPNSRHIL